MPSGYSDEERPLAAFAVLTAAFNASFVALALAARRVEGPLDRPKLPDLVLLAVATHKLSRLLAKDTVTSFLRAPFVEYEGSAGQGEVDEKPRGAGMQRAVGELVTCPYCVGQWVAAGLGYAYVFAPRVTRFAAATLTTIAAADFLHLARARVTRGV